jgi:probable rRNA maturation factor
MSQLHQRFLGIAGPTDVLTFELEHDPRGRVTAGEIVICVPEARRQARVRRITVERELFLYALHGMLHLSGFDDRTAAGFGRMHQKEDEILTRLGIGPVFQIPPSARGRVAKSGRK